MWSRPSPSVSVRPARSVQVSRLTTWAVTVAVPDAGETRTAPIVTRQETAVVACPSAWARRRAPRARVASRRASEEPDGAARGKRARLGRAEHAAGAGLKVGDRRGRGAPPAGRTRAAAARAAVRRGGAQRRRRAPAERQGGGERDDEQRDSAARWCGRWNMATPFRVGLRARSDGCDQPVPRAPASSPG